MEQRESNLIEHPANTWITYVAEKIRSLTDQSGLPVFNLVAPLNVTPPDRLAEMEYPAALLTFGDEAFGESTSQQWDENFWFGRLKIYILCKVPSEADGTKVDVHLQQQNLHYTVMLNLRNDEVPLTDSDNYPIGLAPLFKQGTRQVIAFFGGRERNVTHRFNDKITRLGQQEEMSSAYYVSSIDLPFFCDIRNA